MNRVSAKVKASCGVGWGGGKTERTLTVNIVINFMKNTSCELSEY